MATLYAAKGAGSSTSDLYTIDETSGAGTSVGPIGFAVTGLAFRPSDGRLFGWTSQGSAAHPLSLIEIDPDTGAGTLVADNGIGSNDSVGDICFGADDTLYGWRIFPKQAYTIDPLTAALTAIGSSGLSSSTHGGGLDFHGGVLYVAPTSVTADLDSVDTGTGAATFVGTLVLDGGSPIGSGYRVASLADDGTTLYGVALSAGIAYLITVDTTPSPNCQITTIGALPADTDGLAWSVPPPAGLVVDFVGTPLSGDAPLTVAFTDLTTGSPTSWAWDFGDGDSSSLQNPTHSYPLDGVYDVTLTVDSGAGAGAADGGAFRAP